MSGGSGSGPLVPTFHGFVHNSMDGLVLFEACLSGKLHHVPRRPHDRERTSLIKSGSIFIYEENASGIKRWTDGVAWSPSRILGNFLIYRELEKPFPPGEKKRAMKRKRSQAEGQGRRGSEENESAPEVNMPPTPPSPKPAPPEQNGDSTTNESERELDRQLIGSLVDSYGFRPDGLVKKTMSISINGVSHHLVSYYKVEDVKTNQLRRPMEDARLANIQVRPELYMKQNFRTPVEDSEHYMMNNQDYHAQSNPYGGMMGGGYGMRPGTYAMPSPNYPPSMYGTPASSGGMYSPATAQPGWSSAPQHPGMSAGYSSTAYGSQPYSDYYARTSSSTPQSSMVKTEDPGHTSSSYSHLGPSTNSYAGSTSARPPASGYPSMQSQYHSPMRPTSASYPPTTSVQHSSSTVADGSSTQGYGPSSVGSGTNSQGYGPSPVAGGTNSQPYGPSSVAGGTSSQGYGPPQVASGTSSQGYGPSPVAGSASSQAYGASTGPSAQSYAPPSAPHATPHSAAYSSAAPALSYPRDGATHAGASQGYAGYGTRFS